MRNHLQGLVQDLDTVRVLEGAVRLLAKVGLAVPDATVRRRLDTAGVRGDGGRVYFEPEKTRAFIERQKAGASGEPEELPLRLYPGSHCLYECPP